MGQHHVEVLETSVPTWCTQQRGRSMEKSPVMNNTFSTFAQMIELYGPGYKSYCHFIMMFLHFQSQKAGLSVRFRANIQHYRREPYFSSYSRPLCHLLGKHTVKIKSNCALLDQLQYLNIFQRKLHIKLITSLQPGVLKAGVILARFFIGRKR